MSGVFYGSVCKRVREERGTVRRGGKRAREGETGTNISSRRETQRERERDWYQLSIPSWRETERETE